MVLITNTIYLSTITKGAYNMDQTIINWLLAGFGTLIGFLLNAVWPRTSCTWESVARVCRITSSGIINELVRRRRLA